MNLTIYKFFNPSSSMALYVNDRMNANDDKNRIVFELSKLNQYMKKMYSVIYFMQIPEAKLLCYKLLNDRLIPGDTFHKVKGKSGAARALTITRNTNGINIKIDNGTGRVHDNDFTEFNKKTSYGFIDLNEDEMLTMCLCVKDRIMTREFDFLLRK